MEKLDKSTVEQTQELRKKLLERINMPDYKHEGGLSGNIYHIQDIIELANLILRPYTTVLVEKAEDVLETMKHYTWIRNAGFNSGRPNIEGIYPIIDDKGNMYIKVVYCQGDKNRIVGYAIFDKLLDPILEKVPKKYHAASTKNVIRDCGKDFTAFLLALDSFRHRFPRYPMEFNKNSKNPNATQIFDDGFIRVTVNLNDLLNPKVEFSKPKDRKLYKITDYEAKQLLRKIPVNIGDFASTLLGTATNMGIAEFYEPLVKRQERILG